MKSCQHTLMLLHHITLLNGHTATHRLDTLDPAAVAACRALLPAGGPVPAFPAFRVEIVGNSLFTIWRGQEPIVTCAVGQGHSQAWEELFYLQARFVPKLKPHRAPKTAWLAVAILPGIGNLTQDDIGWLADFERCLAAAILLPEKS